MLLCLQTAAPKPAPARPHPSATLLCTMWRRSTTSVSMARTPDHPRCCRPLSLIANTVPCPCGDTTCCTARGWCAPCCRRHAGALRHRVQREAAVPGGLPPVQHLWGPRRQRARGLPALPHAGGLRARPEAEQGWAPPGGRAHAVCAPCAPPATAQACERSPDCTEARATLVTQATALRLGPRLCSSAGCAIVGVEILEGAQPVHRCPFAGSTAFMLGNEVRRCPRPGVQLRAARGLLVGPKCLFICTLDGTCLKDWSGAP